MADTNTAPTGATGTFETASATTSADNANSGPAAYVITGVALAVMLAIALGLGSCASGLAAIVANGGPGYGGYGYDYDYDFDDLDFDDLGLDELERYIDRLDGTSGRGGEYGLGGLRG